MKKNYILIFLLTIAGKFSYAQTLQHVTNNLDYQGTATIALAANVTIQNTGATRLDVVVKRITQIKPAAHESYFCWALCYDSSTFLSPDPITLNPGDTSNRFEGWIFPHGVAGSDTVWYAFYDMNGNSDTLVIQFTYQFSTGIEELSSAKNSLTIFVNDDKNATVNYSITSFANAKIIISNILGKEVKEELLPEKSKTIQLPLSNLTSGIYFCSLNVDGKFITSKKFVISNH